MYLLLALAQRIPFSLHQPRRLGDLDILEVARALALGVELEEGVCRSLNLAVILDGAEAVAGARAVALAI